MEFLAVVKRDCETCKLVEPVLAELRDAHGLTLYSQDDPSFPELLGGAEDDRALEQSWRLRVETVPTLVRLEDGAEVSRTEGWDRTEWARVTGMSNIGVGLPPFQPGCGSRTQDPGMPEKLALQYGNLTFASREIELDQDDDPAEIAYDRGWTDGMPVVPPTDLRIARMLSEIGRAHV